ncbi:hypothetical protein ACN38_g9955 [Penicillium nordicum]|uniref:Uncharacterized protein n=1 Tax=Penicillium nordicum TaxID=229535 RepID=A0A0M9WCF6_9EURO|nr:hypothetical protein ACN38_g9955 [Penicillium nordicum]
MTAETSLWTIARTADRHPSSLLDSAHPRHLPGHEVPCADRLLCDNLAVSPNLKPSPINPFMTWKRMSYAFN